MKTKSGLIRLVKIIIFVFLLICLLGFLSGLLSHKESEEKYRPFYEAEENFDVLFFGTSHGANGFSPMELWNNSGIVSYNLSQHSEYPAVTYWKILDALKYSTPRLIVLDCYLGGAPDKIPAKEDWSYVHKSLDGMPFSMLKVQAVMDLIPENKDRAEFLWNFIMYHNRYDQLTEDDFHVNYSVEKGSESRVGVLSLNEPELILQSEADDASGLDAIVSIQYYKKIAEVCKERGIELLFAYLPYYTDTASQTGANTMGKWCEQNDVDFINLLYEENLIDYKTDLYDYGHLNPSGYTKVNAFLGKYMAEHYNLPDRRTDASYSHWQEDYIQYSRELSSSLAEVNDLFTYLMMLQNPNFSYTLYVNAPSGLLSNEYLRPFLENAGANLSLDNREETNLFLVADRAAGNISQYINKNSVSETTAFGPVSFSLTDDVIQTFQIGETSYSGYSYEKKVYITVYNKHTNEFADTAVFSLSDGYTRQIDS